MSSKSKKDDAEALQKRMADKEKEFMAQVKARMTELAKDDKLRDETTKELQKRFKIKR